MESMKASTETSSGNSVTGNSSCPIQSQTSSTVSNIHVFRGFRRSIALTGPLYVVVVTQPRISSLLVASSNAFVIVWRRFIRRRHVSTHSSDLTAAEVAIRVFCQHNCQFSTIFVFFKYLACKNHFENLVCCKKYWRPRGSQTRHWIN